MRTYFTGRRPDGTARTVYIAQTTLDKIVASQAGGAEIVITSSHDFVGRQYAKKYLLCLTNDRRSGYCKHAIWACWKKGA